jgi:hypothetical protein
MLQCVGGTIAPAEMRPQRPQALARYRFERHTAPELNRKRTDANLARLERAQG